MKVKKKHGHEISSSLRSYKFQIPPISSQIEKLLQKVYEHNSLALIVIDANELNIIEELYGRLVFDALSEQLESAVLALKSEQLIDPNDLVLRKNKYLNTYLIAVDPHLKSDSLSYTRDQFENLIEKIYQKLYQKIFKTYFEHTKKRPNFKIGFTLAPLNEKMRFDRFLDKVEKEALEAAQLYDERRNLNYKITLASIMIEKKITTLFQPIIEIKSDDSWGVFSFEALSRGPKGSDLESAFMLFDVAEKNGQQFDLDLSCWKNALERAIGCKEKVFLNTYASTLGEPLFKAENLLSFLKEHQLKPEQVVLELSEKQAITNYELYDELIQKMRRAGIQLALDDVGCGYSGLENLILLQPDFMKLDITLIKNINNSVVKQNIVKAICEIGAKMNSRILAEGVETFEEYQTLLFLGVHLFQGYYFAKPQTVSFSDKNYQEKIQFIHTPLQSLKKAS